MSKKKVLRALLTESEALVPVPRKVDSPQYEDCGGEKHFEEQDAIDANRRVVLTSIVERDFEVNNENQHHDMDPEEVVALIERNAGAIHVALNLQLKKETVDKAFRLFMNRKFGTDWLDRMLGEESRILVQQMQDAFVAGAEAD